MIALIPISPGALLALAFVACFVLIAALVYRAVTEHDATISHRCTRYDKIAEGGRR